MPSAGAVLDAIWGAGALGLSASFFDVDAYRDAGETKQLRLLTLLMLFMAGVSRALGSAAILSLNQMPVRRYPLVFAAEGIVFILTAAAFAISAVLVDLLVFSGEIPDTRLFWIVALAHSPILFGLLVMMPYLGEAIDRGLRLWTAVLVFFALHRGLEMPLHAAIGVALIGWLTFALLRVAFGRPVGHLVGAARRLAAGRL